MTQEEHNMLVQNNLMLKYIIQHILKEDNEDFTNNIIANIIADKIMNKHE